jgi:GT2 family glycosyltransferase
MDLSIICINWNSVEYLRDCIASIYEYTHGISFEVIVIDNASPKGGVEILKEQFPGIILIKSNKNLGFSGGNNLAFRHSSGTHVLFLNPDTLLIGPALNTMLDHLKALPDAGMTGCKLLNSDLSIQTSCIQKFPTILNQLTDIESIRLRWPRCSLWQIDVLFSENPKPTVVEVVSGACMMLRRDVFEQAGLFSEEYFMYAEDIDLSHKIMRAGWKTYYVGDAVVIHHGGQSSKQHVVSQWATVMKFRAMTQFCAKTRGKAYAAIFRAAMGCAAIGRLLTISILAVFGSKIVKNNASAKAKWMAILGWSTGFDARFSKARTGG